MTFNAPKASDPKEQDLRERWHEARAKWVDEGMPSQSPAKRAFDHVDGLLSGYLWSRTEAEIAADRAKHPKAKRNMPVGSESPGNPNGRVLP